MFKTGSKVYCKSMKCNCIVAAYVPENKDVLCININEEGEMQFATYWVKENDLTYGWEALDENERKNTSDTRKVLITAGMSSDHIIIITDAPKEAIEKWCRYYNEELENGESTYLSILKKDWYVKQLADSEADDFSREDLDIIGYSEVYDLFDYQTRE